jgi:crossover junction endodeoxyribonuclease RuvC
MAITLGIDPGSRVTGFGVIETREGRAIYLASGCIRTTLSAATGDRLSEIYDGLGELIRLHQPSEVAIEKIFMARSADSAL